MKKVLADWDKVLLVVLGVFLIFHYAKLIQGDYDEKALFVLSVVATLPVVWSALKALRNRQISVDLLASIALIASLLSREWASAVFINLMLTSARIFGSYTEGRARAAIQSLLKLRPQQVKVRKGDGIVSIPVEKVKVGDLVVIESGDRVPIDGLVEQGEASIDQSSLTGESIPILKVKGDTVYSSTLNVSGSLVVKAQKIGKDTTLEKIISLVESSQKEKASIRTSADKFAAWYIVITLIGSVVIYLSTRNLALLLSLLLVACADDIAVSIPMAFMAAIGYAARRGVIIKGSRYLEGLSKVKTIIVDKTGTVTKGKLRVQKVRVYAGYTKEELLKLASMAESISEHPIAKAIVHYAQAQKLQPEKIGEFREIPGKGIEATYKNQKLLVGNIGFFIESQIPISNLQKEEIKDLENQGYNVTLISYNNLIGLVMCADALRPKIREAVDRLKKLGIRLIVMLTGDNEKVAQRIAKEISVTEFHANLLPEDKLAYIKKYLNKDYKVAMVGDGVNDAAGLALADIGIAMGVIGSDAAIEAADIALMRDDFSEIPELVGLSNYTNKIARQDFWIWGITNLLGLILVFGNIIHPEGAAAYNFVTDFFPLINSLRLFNLHLKL